MADMVARLEDTKPLSQVQRVVDTFVAPSRTFHDILRDSSWWLPWLLSVLVTIAFCGAVQYKVGWAKTYNNLLSHASASQQERLAQLPPEQQASQKAAATTFTKYVVWASPLLGLLIASIAAGVLLVTLKFALGGQAAFHQLFAVWIYATLPWLIQGLLTVIVLFAGLDADAFNLNNPIGSNIGYYLPAESPKWLIAFGTALDALSLWALVLLTMGCSIVAKVKRGTAAVAVWGWWMVVTLAKVGIATIS